MSLSAMSNTLWPIARASASLCLLSFLGSFVYAELFRSGASFSDSSHEVLAILWSLAGAALGAALEGIRREQDWRSRFFVLVATPLFALVLLRVVTALFASLFMTHVIVALVVLIFISTLAGVGARALGSYW